MTIACPDFVVTKMKSRPERELILSGRGKLRLWLKLLAPSVIYRIARKAIAKGK